MSDLRPATSPRSYYEQLRRGGKTAGEAVAATARAYGRYWTSKAAQAELQRVEARMAAMSRER